MNKEDVLRIILLSEPTEKSPYKLYGCPPMWPALTKGGRTLFIRPCRTQRSAFPFGWEEVDGLAWQWKTPEKWEYQAIAGQFEDFLKHANAALEDGAEMVEVSLENEDE